MSGGFDNQTEDKSSSSRELSHFSSTHEEADTRLNLHSVNVEASNVVVSVRDTEVIILLVWHLGRMKEQPRTENSFLSMTFLRIWKTEKLRILWIFMHSLNLTQLQSLRLLPTKVYQTDACKFLDGFGKSTLTGKIIQNVVKFFVKFFKVCRKSQR